MPRKYGWAKKRQPPEGYDYVKPILQALENELRTAVADDTKIDVLAHPLLAALLSLPSGIRKNEATWPVHQINWQRSRYIYDMYYEHKKISKELFDWLIAQKIVDGPLIAQWRKQGYERLCSMLTINPSNFTYGTVSICRVPRQKLREDQIVESIITGCRGCCSGKGGYSNIFGNKYGQRLAAIQIRREELLAEQQRRRREKAAAEARARRELAGSSDSSDSSSDEEDSDSDDNDDESAGRKRKRQGSGNAGVWAADSSEKALAEDDSVDAAKKDEEDSAKRARIEGVAHDGEEEGEFEPSDTFTGSRRGFVFKMGSKGLGYYTDTVVQSAAAAASAAGST